MRTPCLLALYHHGPRWVRENIAITAHLQERLLRLYLSFLYYFSESYQERNIGTGMDLLYPAS